MNPSSGILAGCVNGRVWLRIQGKGTHQNSRELKAFVKSHITAAAAGGQRVIVDLSLCTGMDSTFMGMLTCLAGCLEDSGGALHVIHAAGRNGELLRGLGLHEVFTIDDHTENLPDTGPVPDCAPLLSETVSKAERREICLECHEALVAADERNAPKFRDVLDLMRPAMAR